MAQRNHGATRCNSSTAPQPSTKEQPIRMEANSISSSSSSSKLSSSKKKKRTPPGGGEAVDAEIQVVEVTTKETRIDIPTSGDDCSHAWKRKRRRSSTDIVSAPFSKVEYVGSRRQEMLRGIVSLLVTVVVSIPISLVIVLVLPMAILVKTITTACCHPRYSGCSSYDSLSSQDAYLFSQNSEPVFHSVLVLEGVIPMTRLRQVVSSRVLFAKNGGGQLMYARFTDRVKVLPTGPAWVQDKSFQVENHIIPGPIIESKEELEEYVSDLLSKSLNLKRPLWEIIVIEGIGSSSESFLICRFHPCLADGVSLMRVLCHALSDNQIKHLPSKPHFGSATYATSVILSGIFAPYTLIKWLYFSPREKNLLTHSHYFVNRRELDKTITYNNLRRHSASNKVEQARSTNNESARSGYVVRWSAGIALSKVTRVKLVMRATLNDVILSSLSGALRKTLQKRGLDNPPDVRANLVVDTGQVPSALHTVRFGSKASYVPVTLPLECDGAVPRLWQVRRRMEDVKASGESVLFPLFCSFFPHLSPRKWGERQLQKMQSNASIMYASTPGPPGDIHIGGYAVQAVLGVASPPPLVPLSLSVVTYSNHLHLVVTVRRNHHQAEGMATSVLRNIEQQLQAQLSKVQNELHSVTTQYEAVVRGIKQGSSNGNSSSHPNPSTSSSSSSGDPPLTERELGTRVMHLKEEFTVLLTEMRRRQNLALGSSSMQKNKNSDFVDKRKGKKKSTSTVQKKSGSPAESSNPSISTTSLPANPNDSSQPSTTTGPSSSKTPNCIGAPTPGTSSDTKKTVTKKSSGELTGISSILKQPQNKKTVSGNNLKEPQQQGTSNPSPSVTWKDINDEDRDYSNTLASLMETKSPRKKSSRISSVPQKTSHQLKANILDSNTKSSPGRSNSQNSSLQSSQYDLASHNVENSSQRPILSATELQHPNSLSNSTCVLHPMACMPPSALENTKPIIPKSMQRPTSIPAKTIHPSLRSHFAIDKSMDMASSSPSPSLRRAPKKTSSSFTQPITTPLHHTSTSSSSPQTRIKQSYQQISRGGSSRIETDII